MRRNIIIVVILGFAFLTTSMKAQEMEVYAKIDFIGVSFGYKTPSTSLPCDTLCNYYNPLIISLGFEITNNSNKEYFLFGSNTMGYFRDDNTLYAENGIMGEFFLVNENDSILLFSRKYGRDVFAEKSYCTASISYIEENSDNKIFTDFLCKFIHQDKFTVKQKIFNYLKNSKVVYLPFTKDYENIISKHYPKEKSKIAYPIQAITMEMPNPLYVAFGDLDDIDSKVLGEKDLKCK